MNNEKTNPAFSKSALWAKPLVLTVEPVNMGGVQKHFGPSYLYIRALGKAFTS